MTEDLTHAKRKERHAFLSDALTRLTDDQLRAWLGPPGQGSGWGDSRTKDFDGTPVFVKRLRVTAREFEAAHSTRNVYRLPLFYSYGVGSAGFGAFREVAGHEMANHWVLDAMRPGFPLLHHVRVLDREPMPGRRDEAAQRSYVLFWNDSREVETYTAERHAAPYEAVMILEHHPGTLAEWLVDHADSIDPVLDQLFSAVATIRDSGSVHFDAHFSNVVNDGEKVYLTDFGLFMSPEFELDSAERVFLSRHQEYDYGEVLYSVGTQIAWHVGRLKEEERRRVQHALSLDDPLFSGPNLYRLVERAGQVAEVMSVPEPLLRAISRYRQPMLYMGEFLETLRGNPRKDTVYNGGKLRHLLLDAGVPVGT